MDKFWLVWCQESGAPTYKHLSHESACNEAERLAKRHPGRRFEVMERVTSVIKQEVQWEGEMPERSLPF